MSGQSKFDTNWKEVAKSPASVKGKVRRIVRKTAISAVAAFNRPSSENFLRCVYCHHVFDDQRKPFEAILKALKNRGDFVDTDTCIKMLEGHAPIGGRYFHLSFDDGFRNIFTNAAPILNQLSIPSILFVPTERIEIDYEATAKFCKGGYQGVVELLNWQEVRKLASEGMDIGSHTRTHTRFSEMAVKGTLESEIIGSKMDLEQKLGSECKYISWPFGKKSDADEVSITKTKEAGYRACFGAYRGTIVPKVTSKYSIPRHHFETYWPLSHVLYFASGKMEK